MEPAPDVLGRAKRRLGRAGSQAQRLVRRRLPRAAYLASRIGARATYAHTLEEVSTRDEIPELLNRRRLIGSAVEIGVKRGRYSEQLLERWRGQRLISVDPWRAADPVEYVDRANVPQEEHDRFYEEAVARLARFGARSEIWRMASLEAALLVGDASIDFVYIDARHDYSSAAADLAAWYPKVRAGGILAGHDYADGRFPQGDFGVKRAVDEFAASHGLHLHVTFAPSFVEMFPSWLIEVG